jgi:hypothetical protein
MTEDATTLSGTIPAGATATTLTWSFTTDVR